MCVFWDLYAWHFSCWKICFSHVLHPSIILSSIVSCFITFMHFYEFFVPPWSSLIIFMFLWWNFITSCTLCQSWQKRGRNCGDFVVFFKILHVKGRNTCLCKGEMCFILLEGVLTSFFLYLRTSEQVYIHCAYLWWCMSSSPILTCVVSFLSLYTCFYVYAIYYYCFTLRCLDEFCLKCFRNTGCQSLLAINSLLAKFFKSLC